MKLSHRKSAIVFPSKESENTLIFARRETGRINLLSNSCRCLSLDQWINQVVISVEVERYTICLNHTERMGQKYVNTLNPAVIHKVALYKLSRHLSKLHGIGTSSSSSSSSSTTVVERGGGGVFYTSNKCKSKGLWFDFHSCLIKLYFLCNCWSHIKVPSLIYNQWYHFFFYASPPATYTKKMSCSRASMQQPRN